MKLDIPIETVERIIVDECLNVIKMLESQLSDRIQSGDSPDAMSYYDEDKEKDVAKMLEAIRAYKLVARDYMTDEEFTMEFGLDEVK